MTDALSHIRKQHDHIERGLDLLLRQGEIHGPDLLELIEDIVAHLAVHRALLPSSPLFATDAMQHDARMRLLLLRLVALSKLGSSRVVDTLAELRDVFQAHAEVEEQLVLPELVAALDHDALIELDETIERTDYDSRARVAKLRSEEWPPAALCG